MSSMSHVLVRRVVHRLGVGLFGMIAAAQPVLAEMRVWTGNGGNSLWSNVANWSNGIPANGDGVLLLRHPLGLPQNTINDLTNLAVASLRCEATGFTISGGTLRLMDKVLMGGPLPGATLTISAPVEIPGPTLNIISTNSSELALTGVATAPPTVIVNVEGGLRFRAIPGSGFQATTRMLSGFYGLLFTRLEGPLIIGGAQGEAATVALQSGNVFGSFPALTVLTNGTVLNISTFQSVGPLTLDGGTLRLGGRSPQGEISVNGPAMLTGGASVHVGSINQSGPGSLSVTGTVTLSGCSLAFQPGTGTITMPAVIVHNEGSDPINGTFTGLPEGAILTNAPMRYVVSYVGGDGNDITLSPVLEPPAFLSTTQTNGGVEYVIQGQPGFTYIIEATTNLTSPAALIPWVPIRTNGILTGDRFSFIDADSTNLPHRFYRVLRP